MNKKLPRVPVQFFELGHLQKSHSLFVTQFKAPPILCPSLGVEDVCVRQYG